MTAATLNLVIEERDTPEMNIESPGILLGEIASERLTKKFLTGLPNGAIVVGNVSGQQNPFRIFAIALASLTKMSARIRTTSGTYATAAVSTSIDFASAARALIQWIGSSICKSSAGGLCMSFSNTHSK